MSNTNDSNATTTTTGRPLPLALEANPEELLAGGAPLVVSYGGGVDSTALLLKLAELGIRPAAILFADTGSEMAWTYKVLPVVRSWIERTWPGLTLTVVRTNKGGTASAPYRTLYGNCTANETLPDILFNPGRHGCSVEWKGRPLDAWVLARFPERVAAGLPIVRAIGYDASKADTKRSCSAFAKAAKRAEAGKATAADRAFSFWYPLQGWGMTRPDCEALIRRELGAEVEAATGFDCVRKSACIICPSMTREELSELATDSWDECLQALSAEARAIEGKHGLLRFAGLGRSWSWADYLEGVGLLQADWRDQATAAGYLPTDWTQRVAELDSIRSTFQAPYLAAIAAAELEAQAAELDLPELPRAELAAAGRRRKFYLAALLELPYPATVRLRVALEAVEALELEARKAWQKHRYGWKRILRSSDWLNGTAFEPAGLRGETAAA